MHGGRTTERNFLLGLLQRPTAAIIFPCQSPLDRSPIEGLQSVVPPVASATVDVKSFENVARES